MKDDYSIRDIEALTEKEAKALSEEAIEVKGHNVYFVDFGGYFGYSCCVFHSGRHIHYANDYQLHHRDMSKEELRPYYQGKLGQILFEEEELGQPLRCYEEYDKKNYFLRNYYIMRTENVSQFQILRTKEEEKKYERRVRKMHYDPISFAYVKDKDFIVKHLGLFEALMAAKKATETDFEYQEKAFLYEMYNHEYGINWDADFDTLSAFGRLDSRKGASLGNLFDQLGFNDIQRAAYIAARKKYYEATEY